MAVFSRIAGTGSALPEKVLSNKDLEQFVETTDEWIASRTGIRQRHVVVEGETTADLAERAARAAMEAAGVTADQLDMIILGTTTPDLIFPSTACLVQHRLGANGCAAFDVNAACSGFIYALSVADSLLKTGMAKRALVIGAETFSRILDWEDRTTCVLFGDGAGAVVLGAEESADADPKTALAQYIRDKMLLSAQRPDGSKVWANEIIHGAPMLGETLDDSLYTWAKMKEAKIRQWVEDKRILAVEPSALLYMIWASTQHYADFSHQVAILNDHQALSELQFERAVQTVTSVILRGIGLEP